MISLTKQSHTDNGATTMNKQLVKDLGFDVSDQMSELIQNAIENAVVEWDWQLRSDGTPTEAATWRSCAGNHLESICDSFKIEPSKPWVEVLNMLEAL